MVRKNLLLAYVLSFCKNSWFWLGIWIFYYLRFTNYAGIGIVETVMITTVTLAEIPTGAVADLLGKRNTLVISFALEAVGAVLTALTVNLPMLCFSVFVMCIGGALYSGTLEALVFDTLKEHGKENGYDRVISKISAIALIAPAVCGLLGGFMYTVSPSLPFFANATLYGLGALLSLFLVEPHIDTEKFSLKNFVVQTKTGLHELFKTAANRHQTLMFLSVGFIVVITAEMLNSFLGVEFGFSVEQQGILWAAIFIISALASQLTPLLRARFKGITVILVGGLVAFTLVISPFAGLLIGGLTLTFRTSLESIFSNLASVAINEQTESKYRATTISTFNMIKNLPYVLTAFFIGSLSDKYSARYVAVFLGLLLFVMVVRELLKERTASSDSSTSRG